MKLSKRLQLIADHVPRGSHLVDIGSDHALLPVYLVSKGIVPGAIAGEVAEGPWIAAKKQVENAGLTTKIAVRRGDGLKAVVQNEVEVAVIAGMGGRLIADILESGQHQLTSIHTLLLQPNVGEAIVRTWLLRHGWYLENEWIIEEDGRIYEFLKATRSEHSDAKNNALYQGYPLPLCSDLNLGKNALLRFGPHLVRNASDIFLRKWQGELAKLEKVKNRISRSVLASSRQKFETVSAEISMIEEVIRCTQKDK